MKNEKMAAIAVNKSLLKEYQTSCGRTVYLDKDSEFQIKLFNPTTETVAAEVFVNEKPLGEKIIIRPGQLIWLERYLDEARKFRFETYEVDTNVEEVKQAIRNNGNIKVKFYKEKQHCDSFRGFTTLTYPYREYPGLNSTLKWNGNDTRCAYNTNDFVGTSITPDTTSLNLFAISSTSLGDEAINTAVSSYSITPPKKYKSKRISQSTETGRVEKGGYSNQRFTTAYLDIETWPFETEEIKLLPKSQKPVYKEDLQRLYCTECGRKIKQKFKFCPFCGAKQ